MAMGRVKEKELVLALLRVRCLREKELDIHPVETWHFYLG